jgi:NADPH:quinone reductase-like Zn-dependent oxidoreductase
MKAIMLSGARKLTKLAADHRETIILQLTRIMWGGAFSALTHLGVNATTLNAWHWAAEPAAIGAFGIAGVVLSRLMQRWAAQKTEQQVVEVKNEGAAATRVAVAAERAGVAPDQLTHAAIAAVPDDVHTAALAQVIELNKNGGVPAPPMV